MFGSAKILTSPTSSSAFYKIPLPCPRELSILNSKNKRREENRAELKNISFFKKRLWSFVSSFLSVVVNNFYCDSKWTSMSERVLKTKYKTMHNYFSVIKSFFCPSKKAEGWKYLGIILIGVSPNSISSGGGGVVQSHSFNLWNEWNNFPRRWHWFRKTNCRINMNKGIFKIIPQ